MAQAEVFNNVDLLAIIATNLEHRDVIRMIASSKNNLTGSGRVWLEEKRGFFLSRVKYLTLLWRKLNNPPCLEFDLSCVMGEIHTIFSSNRHSSNDQRLLDVLALWDVQDKMRMGKSAKWLSWRDVQITRTRAGAKCLGKVRIGKGGEVYVLYQEP